MILNRQRGTRVPVGKLDRFAAKASELLRLPAGSVTVCLVNEAEMARWNRAYRRKNGPTDVLSFPADASRPKADGGRRKRQSGGKSKTASRSNSKSEEENGRRYLGDIAIAPGVARRNALRLRRRFEDEMRILILHGMLHLMGYDHETDTGQMDRRERKLRRSLHLE